MTSLDDSFWKKVDIWCRSKRKPVIVLQVAGGGSSETLRGTIANFVPRVSISIRAEGEGLRVLDLTGFRVHAARFPRPNADSDLKSWGTVSRFTLRRSTGNKDALAFTELRDFGESN